MVDTAFSYGSALMVCKFLQESCKVEESSLVCMKSEMQILRFYLAGQKLCQISHLHFYPFHFDSPWVRGFIKSRLHLVAHFISVA